MAEGRTLPALAEGRGVEWLIEAVGAEPRRLADPAAIETAFAAIVAALDLHPVAPAQWHRFPPPAPEVPGGVTGVLMLAESHLAVHTFPEHGALCLNVFCCRPRAGCDFAGVLAAAVGAREVAVRRIDRRYAPEP